MTKRYYTKLIFTLALLIAGGALVKIATSQSVPNPVSLRVLASQSGNYVSYLSPNVYPRYDFNQLVAQSTVIITGTAGTNVCKLSPDGTFITTDFQVIVQSVVKGNLPVGSNITVSLPGGKAAFPNMCDAISGLPCPPPTTAEIRVPWFKKLSNGSQYYLFLISSPRNSMISQSSVPSVPFKPTGGPQGVFQIANGVVTSNSGRLHDPMWQYNNMTVADFNLSIETSFIAGPPLPATPPP